MKKAVLAMLLAAVTAFSGCAAESQTQSTASAGSAVTLSADSSDMFTNRDLEIGYDEDSCPTITLSGSTASCTSDAVQINGSTVTIIEEGTYLLTGTLSDGMIVVNAEDSDKVQLVLDGVDITSATSAAIYVLEADKVFITTAAGSENTLANGGEYVAIDDNNIDAVIFSKADLTLNGAGTLTIQAAAGHGIVSKDDLVLTSGTYVISSAKSGLSGKDSIRIASGSYTITSGTDGIHAENDDDASLGFLYILGGTFQIDAQGDGISAGSYLTIEDGDFTITAGGGSGNASQSSAQSFGWGVSQTTDTDSTSTKGIKAATSLTITGGSFAIDTADDAIHTNGDIAITGGTYQIATGDDGIHADGAVAISGGDITITESYEGIEGLTIEISGGTIDLTASDDGLNAAGGNDSSGFGGRGSDMFSASSDACITISGGVLKINAEGDGIDSNGDLYVTGGETYVSGPTSSANGALDYGGSASISGGILVAAGASGMAQNFGSGSTQGVMMVTVNSGTAGSTITLTDSDGNVLLAWQSEKAYSSVVISCPEITQGQTYTLTAGSSSTQVTMSSLVYSSSGMGGMGGNMGGGNTGGNVGGNGGMGGRH